MNKKIIISCFLIISLITMMMIYKNNTMDKATDTIDKATDAIDKAADTIEINVKGFKMQYIPQNRSLTVEDFQNIELGESIEEIEEKIGEPDGWIGYGILQPVYVLDDGRVVVCYFSQLNYKDLEELIVCKGNNVDYVLKRKGMRLTLADCHERKETWVK